MYEQIKAEIEQRKATAKILIQHPDDADYRNGVLDALDGIFAFVESLEKEQTERLDEAAKKYANENSFMVFNPVEGCDCPFDEEKVIEIFKAGAKWHGLCS